MVVKKNVEVILNQLLSISENEHLKVEVMAQRVWESKEKVTINIEITLAVHHNFEHFFSKITCGKKYAALTERNGKKKTRFVDCLLF